jgi:hypothetical protein
MTKKKHLTFNSFLDEKYGSEGTASREEFKRKAEKLKNETTDSNKKNRKDKKAE